MSKERRRAIRRRLGPIGMSLIASALTAAGFAAFSLADSGGGNDGKGGDQRQVMPAPPPGGGVMFQERLSPGDRQKLEAFRQCMEDQGAPAPPQRIDPSDGPPKPPSASELEKIQKAHEACKDELPEDLQNTGPPGIGTFHCGPPPGAPGEPGNQGNGGENQQQSNESGAQSSGSAA